MIVGNCVLYPAEVFREAGFMDPAISAQYGDAEFTTRLRKRGWRLLIEPRARVFCQPNYEHVSVTSRPIGEQVELLFRKRTSGSNIAHQFRQLWHSGPSKAAGVAAFFAFYGRAVWRKIFGAEKETTEPKLRDIYSNAE